MSSSVSDTSAAAYAMMISTEPKKREITDKKLIERLELGVNPFAVYSESVLVVLIGLQCFVDALLDVAFGCHHFVLVIIRQIDIE